MAMHLGLCSRSGIFQRGGGVRAEWRLVKHLVLPAYAL